MITELRDTEEDLWINRQGETLWWTVSLPGNLREELKPSTDPARDGAEV